MEKFPDLYTFKTSNSEIRCNTAAENVPLIWKIKKLELVDIERETVYVS